MSHSTKEKILIAANKLFSKYGFDGASVRDIAKEAEVNLGAINYHFESKEKLYLELLIESRKFVENEMEQLISENDYNLKEFTFVLYKKFFDYGDAVNNAFKLILSDSISLDTFEQYDFQRSFAPPGLSSLVKVISKEYGRRISEFGKIWVAKSIFTIVTHSVLMQHSSLGKYHMMALPPDALEKHAESLCDMLVEANVNYALQNPEKFEKLSQCYTKK